MLSIALFVSFVYRPSLASANVDQYAQMSEQISLARTAILHRQFRPIPVFDSVLHKVDWLGDMAERLKRKVPDFKLRMEIINTVRYEAQRAGLDPQIVFSVIEVESNFDPYAVSSAGAIGLMQVMPFWTDVLGNGDINSLYHPLLNIRYGCLILSHYLEMENGNLARALARYNGSLGKNTYSDKVFAKFNKNWQYEAPTGDVASP